MRTMAATDIARAAHVLVGIDWYRWTPVGHRVEVSSANIDLRLLVRLVVRASTAGKRSFSAPDPAVASSETTP
jgi:hypothetical protein